MIILLQKGLHDLGGSAPSVPEQIVPAAGEISPPNEKNHHLEQTVLLGDAKHILILQFGGHDGLVLYDLLYGSNLVPDSRSSFKKKLFRGLFQILF